MKIPSKRDRLPLTFYDRPAETVARELLGKALLRKINGQWIGGWIVETEAYLSDGDPSSHSHRGMTASNAAMFDHPGTLYVYPIHAKYCMNAVTENHGKGSAVLIRAIEPVWGIDPMMQHRQTSDCRRLTRGPAMLCQALCVDRRLDGANLISATEITIADGDAPATITCGPRIGISTAKELPLRFFVDGNWFVSGKVRDHQQRPTRPSPEELSEKGV